MTLEKNYSPSVGKSLYFNQIPQSGPFIGNFLEHAVAS